MEREADSDHGGDALLDLEEAQYLRPEVANLTRSSDVFEREALNIASARAWLSTSHVGPSEFLTQSFQIELHRRMYGEVWVWAGKLRRTENNIGIAPEHISEQWERLLGDAAYWLSRGTYSLDEALVRYYFHQREIQPFHDGNSRLLRVVVNIVAEHLAIAQGARERFAFGRGGDLPQVRADYLAALEVARGGDFGPLVRAARQGGEGP